MDVTGYVILFCNQSVIFYITLTSKTEICSVYLRVCFGNKCEYNYAVVKSGTSLNLLYTLVLHSTLIKHLLISLLAGIRQIIHKLVGQGIISNNKCINVLIIDK